MITKKEALEILEKLTDDADSYHRMSADYCNSISSETYKRMADERFAAQYSAILLENFIEALPD